MKKRILATLLVGAVAASGVIGLSACGVGGVVMPKGEDVTKEVWEKAFTDEQMETLNNYTASAAANRSVIVTGSYKSSGGSDEEISLKLKSTSYQTILYNEESLSYYSESNSSNSSTTSYDGVAENKTIKNINKSYIEKGENENEYWSASYSKNDTQTDTGGLAIETYWSASKAVFAPSNNYPGLVENKINTLVFSNTKEEKADTKSGTISELYDLFEYNGGVYTATLYSQYVVEEDDFEMAPVVEYKISVSFKDGYLIGYSAKVDASDTYENTTYTIKAEQAYAITGIGSTDPLKKKTGDVKKAIEKAKEDYTGAETNR